MMVDDWIRKTIDIEGGYVFDPDDPGGETKYGISKKSYPDLDIENLTLDEAVAIYRKDYWDVVCPENVDDRVKWKVFDMAVNMGPDTASAILHIVSLRNNGWTLERSLHELAAAQMKHYARLIRKSPRLVKYLSGWTNRAMEVG